MRRHSFREERRDSSLSLRWRSVGTGWELSHETARSTRHQRDWQPGDGWSVRSWGEPPQSPQAHLRTLADSVPVPDTGMHVTLTYHQLERHYRNSEDSAFAQVLPEWEILARFAQGKAVRRRAESLVAVAEILAALDEACLPYADTAVGTHRVAPGMPFALTPDIAGVLLHELIGHALEEGDLRPGDKVLPDSSAVAVIPRRDGHDDEGVATAAMTVVSDGTVVLTPADRMSGLDASGHSWCGAHQPAARLRLTHLAVSPPDILASRATGTHIQCVTARGGRYFHGRAILDIAQAWLDNGDGTRQALEPFRLTVNHEQLRLAEFMALPSAVTSPEGECSKSGDTLSSAVRCPPLVIAAAEVWP